MVKSYAMDRDYLPAGESATVTVTIRNTSTSRLRFAGKNGADEKAAAAA